MPRIVIAGGGIAGLDALVALRAHVGAEPEIS
jgi:predicted NAD/FAD-dependent oxidoreductase